MNNFWKVLFNEDEFVCTGATVFETSLKSLSICQTNPGAFFSINPLKDRRLDSNVTSFRNILIEFDKLTATEQLAKLGAVPYSTLVWSGGKSYHAIISLEIPCTAKEEYDRLVRRVFAKLPLADQSTKNASRFSRSPKVLRDNGKIQSLVDIKGRISREVLEAWLGPEEVAAPIKRVTYQGLVSSFTNYFLMFGAEDGEWNGELFRACADMTRAGFGIEEIKEKLHRINGYLTPSDIKTIKSAHDRAKKDLCG